MAQVIRNPPFDSRISSLAGLESVSRGSSGAKLSRGYMIQDKGLGKVQYAVHFLYNPSIVQVSHQTDVTSSTTVTPQNYRNPLDKGNWNIPLAATVGFNLLFDRTYELWNRGAANPNLHDMTTSPSYAGVRVDWDAVCRVVGIYQPNAIQLPNTDPQHFPSTLLDNGKPGPMPLTPITVFFGGKDSLSYRGYVSSLELQWTHFSQLMVPMRCTVGVTMNLMTQNSWDSDYDDVKTSE